MRRLRDVQKNIETHLDGKFNVHYFLHPLSLAFAWYFKHGRKYEHPQYFWVDGATGGLPTTKTKNPSQQSIC